MDRTLKCDHSLQSCCAVLYQFVILENLTTLDLALSGVKGLNSIILKVKVALSYLSTSF